MRLSAQARVRTVAGIQAGVGLVLLGAPARDATRYPPAWLVRLLGLRMVAQGAAMLARPALAPAGTATDALHAASMVVAAALAPRRRRAALASAALAGVFATATAVATRGTR